MPRGDQLTQMLSDLRSEAGLSSLVSLSINQKPQMIRLLQRTQRRLYDKIDWPFKKLSEDKLCAAGQRYYDFAPDIDPEKTHEIWYRFGTQWLKLNRGITPAHYSAFDSDNGARNSPAQRWDWHSTAPGTPQVEIWPVPSVNGVTNGDGTLRFKGVRKLSPLVQDSDTCEVDSDIIVLFAAAEMLASRDAKDAPAKLQAAKDMLRDAAGDLKGRQQSAMGSGQTNNEVPQRRQTILVGKGTGI